MITRFRVQNYKALRDVTLDLTPVHVLIGPNDSGKTSLLEALAALCRSVERPFSEVFRRSTERRMYHFSVSWTPPCYQFDGYELETYRDDKIYGGFPISTKERLQSIEGEPYEINAQREATSLYYGKSEESSAFRNLKDQGYPEDLLDQISAQLRGVHFYRFSPEALKIPVVLDARRQGRMEFNGFGLPQLLDEIRNDRGRFARLEERFCELFLYVAALELPVQDSYASLPSDHRQVQRSEFASGKGIQFRLKDGGKLLAEDASDGMFFVLAYLALLHLPEPPRVLLIEEPENGIHPGRLKEIIRILKQLVSEQSHTQVLMTTHSPYVLHEFTPEEVTVCVREKNGEVKTRRLSESKAVQEQMDFFSLGEIWTMEGDEALIQPATDENLHDATPAPSIEVQPAP